MMKTQWDTRLLRWIRKPEKATVTENRVEIWTQPHTDLWQRTYYHFRNDNAPVLQMTTDERFFPLRCERNLTASAASTSAGSRSMWTAKTGSRRR